MLKVTDLHAYYGKSHILRGVNLSINRGEIIALLGRNGVGRSTLVKSIKDVITKAIVKGGSTMNDFFDVNGDNGYFQNEHKVYGRENQPCYQCQFPINQIKLGQRSSFFCKKCQK